MQVKYKNVLVYGVSVSGEWVARLLVKKKANVFLYDDDETNLDKVRIKNCYVVKKLNENILEQFDFVVVSPSIPKDNEYLVLLEKLNKDIYSEVEFASSFCKKFIAITGTNGKTTTTKIVTALLQSKTKAIACGNIGYPLSRAVIESKNSVKVVEVSSFMLEHSKTFSPHAVTITNIEQDHLIRHKTMQEYIKLKKSIYKNLKFNDYAIVNIDEKIPAPTNSKIITYSYNHNADVCVKNGAIYLNNEKVINLNELKLKGKHNVYNVMCAIGFALAYKVKLKQIRNVLLNLEAEKYRIEKLNVQSDFNFVNDSKSTNIASTLASVETVKGAIILLLGGSNKELDYKPLFKKLSKRVKFIAVFGEIANKLILANENKFKIEKFKDLESSFDYVVNMAKPNDTILLSPASASYDQYKSYVDRGEHFNSLVQKFLQNRENDAKK